MDDPGEEEKESDGGRRVSFPRKKEEVVVSDRQCDTLIALV